MGFVRGESCQGWKLYGLEFSAYHKFHAVKCPWMGNVLGWQLSCGICPGVIHLFSQVFTRLDIGYDYCLFQVLNVTVLCTKYHIRMVTILLTNVLAWQLSGDIFPGGIYLIAQQLSN